MTLKILNLYAGIGGNRKLWGDDVDVTAIENNPTIAGAYKKLFPNDKVIVGDAHQYLLENFEEFDFIWSSPPCQAHSRFRKNVSYPGSSKIKAKYPNMELYEEILFLKHYFKGLWVVENVMPYYEPLIKPYKVGRHCFWANFPIPNVKVKSTLNILNGHKRDIGLDIRGMKFNTRKDQILNNCVEPKLAEEILKVARGLMER
jgi:DNA (cytosine-5)-methyltransferase 1